MKMLTKAEAYEMAKMAREKYIMCLMEKLNRSIADTASRGGMCVEEEIQIDEVTSLYCVTTWTEACEMSEKIVEEYRSFGYTADFQCMSTSAGLWCCFRIYWGNNIEEDFVPYWDWDKEEEEE